MNYQGKTRLVLDIVAIHCANSEMILAISAAMRAKLNLVNSKTYISLAVDAACVEMQYIYDAARAERRAFIGWICINMPPTLPSIDKDTRREHRGAKPIHMFVQHYNVLAKKSFFYANHPKQDQCLRNLCFMNILYPSIKSGMFRQLINTADERRCIRLPGEIQAGYDTNPNQQVIYFMKWGEYVLTNKAYLSDQYWSVFTVEQRTKIDRVIFNYWPQ